VIFLTASPFSKRDYDRFGVDILKRNNINVFVLDCTPFLNLDFDERYSETLRYEFHGNYLIESYETIKKKLNMFEDKNIYVIDLLKHSFITNKLKKLVRNKGAKIMHIELGSMPAPSCGTINLKNRLKKIFNPLSYYRAIKSRVITWYIKSFYTSPDILVASGESSVEKYAGQEGIEVILAHSMDYDIYLAHEKTKKNNQHMVFIDIDIISHADYVNLGIEPPATVEKYYPVLNRFFDNVEKITGQEIIIASHPRANHFLVSKNYNGRSVIMNKTAELIRDSSIVFFHGSTAINFAVLWKKPVVSLTSEELEKSWLRDQIESQSQAIGSQKISIDRVAVSQEKIKKWMQVDIKKYDNYKEKYIKKAGSPELPVWSIVSEYLLSATNGGVNHV